MAHQQEIGGTVVPGFEPDGRSSLSRAGNWAGRLRGCRRRGGRGPLAGPPHVAPSPASWWMTHASNRDGSRPFHYDCARTVGHRGTENEVRPDPLSSRSTQCGPARCSTGHSGQPRTSFYGATANVICVLRSPPGRRQPPGHRHILRIPRRRCAARSEHRAHAALRTRGCRNRPSSRWLHEGQRVDRLRFRGRFRAPGAGFDGFADPAVSLGYGYVTDKMACAERRPATCLRASCGCVRVAFVADDRVASLIVVRHVVPRGYCPLGGSSETTARSRSTRSIAARTAGLVASRVSKWWRDR